MDNVGDNISAKSANWTFGGDVHLYFDDHVNKSVPLYGIGHDLIEKLSDYFLLENSKCYDLGCSTGTLLKKLATRHKNKNINFIGCDIEKGMIESSIKKCEKLENVEFINESAVNLQLDTCNLIISYYTLQFIHPSTRQEVFNKIFNSLNWGGGFIFFEKVRAPDARFQDIMTSIYNEFKIDQGYTGNEIIAKSRSLKGVLDPFSTQANYDMAKRAGFVDIMSIFKCISFEGFLAIK